MREDEIIKRHVINIAARVLKRPALIFDVSVVEHCNLNCRGCGSFAPLARESYLDIKEYEKDIAHLSKLSGGIMQHINILGGGAVNAPTNS